MKAIDELHSTNRIAKSIEGLIAAQDAGNDAAALCLERDDERARAERIARIMGWERIGIGEKCVRMRRKKD